MVCVRLFAQAPVSYPPLPVRPTVCYSSWNFMLHCSSLRITLKFHVAMDVAMFGRTLSKCGLVCIKFETPQISASTACGIKSSIVLGMCCTSKQRRVKMWLQMLYVLVGCSLLNQM